MSIRKQIVLDHWLSDHLSALAEDYGISFSAVIRVLLYCALLNMEKGGGKGNKYAVGKCADALRSVGEGDMSRTEFRKFCSDLAFEVRKSSESHKKFVPAPKGKKAQTHA